MPNAPKSSDRRSLRRNGLAAILASGVLAVVLVAWAYVVRGADNAGRAATDIAMPTGLLWLFLFAAAVTYFCCRQHILGSLFLSVWLLMGFFFNGLAAQSFFQTVEHPPGPAIDRADLPLCAVVPLGGGASQNGFGVDEVNRDGERIVSAAQMWHAGQTQSIICTGMSLPTSESDTGAVGRRLLLSLGVPDDAIIVIGGEDTHGEMIAIKKLLHESPRTLPRLGKIGLITSAFHMNRALRLAKKESLEMIPIPVAYRSTKTERFSGSDLIPSAEAGHLFKLALKERLARLLGK
ncbi:MAG: YdcF family protein [Pirellulaceae bacterium]